MSSNGQTCASNSDCSSNYCWINTCAEQITLEDVDDAVKTWVIILIVIGVLILIGIIACIVCCICGAAYCCKKAMKEDKDSNEGGEREESQDKVIQMAAVRLE